MLYVQLIHLFLFCFLPINLSYGNLSTILIYNKTSARRFPRHTDHDTKCQIPDDPLHGEYTIGGDKTKEYKTGDYVPEYRVLVLKCINGYKPSPPEHPTTLCLDGLWTPEPTFCSRACRPLYASKSTDVRCSFRNKPLETCNDPVEGTIAHFSCKPLYEDPSIDFSPFRLCQDSDWNGVPQCFPICGQKHPIGGASIIGGTTATIGDYPWQVGIYTNKKVFQCGGAVISPSVILSAAHCFADLSDGTPYPKENYLIAAGKHYRNYDDSKDEYSQYPTIDAIHIPSQYRGSQLQHEADIAVIILETSLTLSEAVQPVCVDWSNLFEYQQLVPDNYGVVTGWGYTREGSDLADKLKELSVPFVPFNKCFDSVPKSFQKFVRGDKICAGYLNSSTAVCHGDSGGALVFPRSSNGRFYIRGIVSTSPATNARVCDSDQYGLYTSVSKHIEFVSAHYHDHTSRKFSASSISVTPTPVTKLDRKDSEGVVTPVMPTPGNPTITSEKPSPSPGSCQIPSSPPNGAYVSLRAPMQNQLGDYVPPYSVMTITCEQDYLPRTKYSFCVNSIWEPTPSVCYRLCPLLNSTKTTRVACKYNGVRLGNCDNPIEGTIAEVSCEPFYEEPSIHRNPFRVCRGGTWNYPVQQCYPICGEKRPRGRTNVVNGTIAISGDYPWHVAIYDASHHKNQLCGGSIISQRVVLSAAHCFTDFEGKLLPKEKYLLAAGKYYRVYDDPRDRKLQYSHVDAIHIPETYKGLDSFFEADIAVLILTRAFRLSESIQPVCIDLSNELENEPLTSNSYGVITGFSRRSEQSEELQELRVPYVPYNQCYNYISRSFKEYLTHDKICAGYLDQRKSACDTDSGGALVFPRQLSDRYYVRGVLSTTPHPIGFRGCNSNQYAIYTLVSKYAKFIRDLITLHRE